MSENEEQVEEQERELDEAWGISIGGFLDLFAHCDLTERLGALYHVLCGDKSHDFALDRRGEWSGIEVERLLRRHGIRLWDRDFDRDCLYFRVKVEQARFTEYLMLRCGVLLAGELFDPRHINVQPLGEPQAQGPALKPRLQERIIGLFLGGE